MIFYGRKVLWEVTLEDSCRIAPSHVCLKEVRRPSSQFSWIPFALAASSFPQLRGSSLVAFLWKSCHRKCFNRVSCFWGTQESSEPRDFLAASAELLFKCNCLYSPSPSRLETVPSRLCLRSLPQCILVRQGYAAPRAGAGRRGTARVATFGNSSALLLCPAY